MSVLVEKADLSLKYISHYNKVKELLYADSGDVINAPREKAFQDFVLQGIPSQKNENYKYTNLISRFNHDFSFVHKREKQKTDPDAIFHCDVPQLDSVVKTTTNGWFNESRTEDLPEGVILESLDKIAKQNPGLIENFYAKIADTGADATVAFNTAFAKDGYLLYVPKNTVCEIPIQIINFLDAASATLAIQRNLIIVEEGADVKIIICDHTLNLNRYLSDSVTEIFVGENARFDYYTLQNQHNHTTNINSVYIKQERDSVVTSHTSSLHGGLIRNNMRFVLNGENAEAKMFGMAFLDRSQHVDNFTQIIHDKPNCRSNQVYKNVLDEEATGAFSGLIHVVRDAQNTAAFQRNNNLLLSDKAVMQTKPQLIIDADDVKCSHGATVGQLDEEAMFYLRARGIDEDKARMMMMNAFMHEVVREISVEALRDRIDELVERRLNGEVAKCHECAYQCEI